jgi:hypothetical protein
MLLTGLLPLVAIVGFGLWVWTQHMYTLGLSVKGGLILVSVAFADVLLISGGPTYSAGQKIQTDALPQSHKDFMP